MVTAVTGVADTVCACVCEPRWARRCGLKGGTESQQLLQRAPAWIGPSASCSSTSRILWEGSEGNMVPSAKAFQWLLLILQHSCGNTGVVVGPASTPLESPDFLLPTHHRFSNLLSLAREMRQQSKCPSCPGLVLQL